MYWALQPLWEKVNNENESIAVACANKLSCSLGNNFHCTFCNHFSEYIVEDGITTEVRAFMVIFMIVTEGNSETKVAEKLFFCILSKHFVRTHPSVLHVHGAVQAIIIKRTCSATTFVKNLVPTFGLAVWWWYANVKLHNVTPSVTNFDCSSRPAARHNFDNVHDRCYLNRKLR